MKNAIGFPGFVNVKKHNKYFFSNPIYKLLNCFLRKNM